MAIKARRKVEFTRVTIQVPIETHERVEQYAKHLGGTTDAAYVYAESARQTITRDKSFAPQG